MSFNVRKGDKVKILSGKEKGSEGSVSRVLRSKNRVIVEGLNMASRHEKPSQNNQTGGIVKKEQSIHVSNVMVLDKSGVPTRVRRRREAGKPSVRVSVRTGKDID